MRSFSLLALAAAPAALFALGCHTHAMDDRADAEIAELYASGASVAISPTCEDNAPIGPSCGLYTRQASTPEFRESFRATRCAGRSDAECQAIFQQSLDAWLSARYSGANAQVVASACRAQPARCEDPIAYELLLLDAHNRALRDGTTRATSEAEPARGDGPGTEEHDALPRPVRGNVLGAAFSGTSRCRVYPNIATNEPRTICAVDATETLRTRTH